MTYPTVEPTSPKGANSEPLGAKSRNEFFGRQLDPPPQARWSMGSAVSFPIGVKAKRLSI